MADRGDEFARAEELLRVSGQSGQSLESTIKAADAAQKGQDRSTIAKFITCIYIFVVGLITIYLVVRGLWCRENTFPDLIELMKIGIVPIVALMIGYYFGSERA